MKVLDEVRDAFTVAGRQVFGEPYSKNGVTVIPVARVSGGGGGGGAKGFPETPAPGGVGLAVEARPAGAFVIHDDDVRWMPAFDLNRAIAGGVLLGVVAVLSWRSVVKMVARRP
ncbi:MAG TPA: spore germination protein GerW family protein [Candidatus Dormibacteraeota bacterium]|nr:spore germination protein GerW family protein [Candidatus Dormibacteraeota bacterium]